MRGLVALVLLVSGCLDGNGESGARYVLIEAEARETGARLRVDGREITDVLPERIEIGAEVTVETEALGELPVEAGAGELVVLRGHDARAEPFAIGIEATEDRLWVRGSDAAVRALAERVGAEVIGRADGTFELYAPALLSVVGDYDAGEGIEAVLPIVVSETLGEVVGLPVSATVAELGAALGPERKSEDALRLAAALMGVSEREGGAASALGGELAMDAARLDDAPIALLVGVYRTATHTLVIDIGGGFEIHPNPDLTEPPDASPWDVTEAALPRSTLRGRVVATGGGHTLLSSSGVSIAVHAFTDGTITVGGERYTRHHAYLRPLCRYPIRRDAQ